MNPWLTLSLHQLFISLLERVVLTEPSLRLVHLQIGVFRPLVKMREFVTSMEDMSFLSMDVPFLSWVFNFLFTTLIDRF